LGGRSPSGGLAELISALVRERVITLRLKVGTARDKRK
jgi:hypothetical protein